MLVLFLLSFAAIHSTRLCLSSFCSHSQRFIAYLSMLHVGNESLHSPSMPHLHIQLLHALPFTSVKFLEPRFQITLKKFLVYRANSKFLSRYDTTNAQAGTKRKCESVLLPARGACSFREDGPLNSYSALPTLHH